MTATMSAEAATMATAVAAEATMMSAEPTVVPVMAVMTMMPVMTAVAEERGRIGAAVAPSATGADQHD